MKYGMQILFIIPALMTLVKEAVEAVEVIGGRGTGAAKKAAVLEAVDAGIAAAGIISPAFGAVPRDVLLSLVDTMIESVLTLKKAAEVFTGSSDDNEPEPAAAPESTSGLFMPEGFPPAIGTALPAT